MKRKIILSTILFFTLSTTPLSVFAATISTPLRLANINTHSISPQSDNIVWQYKVENGKIYKRLYNTSNGTYIGEWIYVGEYNP